MRLMLLSQNHINHINQDNVTFVVADLTAMPEEWRAQFDYVMTFDTVHDVSHPALALAGVQRVLKPDALFTMEEVTNKMI